MLAFSPYDRGLHYGDGLFETAPFLQGQPLNWQAHQARLALGCQRLQIPPPNWQLLDAQIQDACKNQQTGVLKLIHTRGEGGRGYRPPLPAQPNTQLLVYPLPTYPADYFKNGVIIRTCHTRLARQPVLAGLKHLNRLEQVLARQEWQDDTIFEGVMLDTQAYVIEGTMSNLWWVNAKGELCTPRLSHCGIAGVMQKLLLEYCRIAKISVKQRAFRVKELTTAREIFLTNSVIGIMPVKQWEKQHFNVGELTQRLRQHAIAQAWIVNYD